MSHRAEVSAGVASVDLTDQSVLVTGSTDGIGRETALALGRLGADVMVHGRDSEKGTKVVAAIDHAGGQADFLRADFTDFDAVRDLADHVADRVETLDILVNNAGAYFRSGQLTEAGFERTIAVNHLAPFLLTNRLRPLLSDSGRVVTVSSAVHRRADLDFRSFRSVEDFDGLEAYSRSKLANILFTRELARRLEGPTANCLHPGLVPGSALWREAPRRVRLGVDLVNRLPHAISRWFAKTPVGGAETSVYLAVSPEVADVTGLYYADCEPKTPSAVARDDALARELWSRSATLVDLERTDEASDDTG